MARRELDATAGGRRLKAGGWSQDAAPSSREAGPAIINPTRLAAIEAVIDQIITRRGDGEILTDEAIIAAHPDLMPELRAELDAWQQMHRARLAAERAGAIEQGMEVRGEGLGDAREPREHGEEETAIGVIPWSAPDSLLTPNPSPLSPRVAIHGYTIQRQISTGGQATVFQATQDSTGRAVAIKVIFGGPLVTSRHRQRFDREAQILASLQHPHIVGILDRGQTNDGSLFLAMEYIDGCSLDEYLTEGVRGEG